MRTPSKLSFIFALVMAGILSAQLAAGQNNALVLNGAYIVMNGGTSSNRSFLVVNQSHPSGMTRSSGHIISENQYNYIRVLAGTSTGSYVFPFGYSTTAYLPLTINKTSAGSSNFDASTWGTNNQNVPRAGVSRNGTLPAVTKMVGANGDSVASVLDRWWDIYSPSAMTANITFSYRSSENSTTSNPTTNLDAQIWNGTGWDAPISSSSAGVVAGVGSATLSGVTTFAPWILVHNNQTLPVTITTFNTYCSYNGAHINWATASEINSDYFNVEKSSDGLHFESIGRVKAAGHSTALLNYSFIDYNSIGTSYYRLKEVDFNGETSFTDVIHATCENNKADVVSIYPNPATDFLNYNIITQVKGLVTIELNDQSGHPIIREQYNTANDFNVPATNISMLNEGFYVARITCGNKVYISKFIKVKK